MLILNSPQVVQETALRWKKEYRIALVPTLGCLHEGHIALIRKAQEYGQKCIVSIFVNPLQFSPGEDFTDYPRTLEEDETRLREFGVDCLFLPSERELYPPGFSTQIKVSGLTQHLCGASRPGHFEGVATVCLKLFQITSPDFVVFGEKDFQQLRMIQKLTEDLNLPITILSQTIVRETDGLAMSSRNRYLSPEDRKRAIAIPIALNEARAFALSNHGIRVGELVIRARESLAVSDLNPEYLEVASEKDLVPLDGQHEVHRIFQPRLFIAARVGKTRLIDNISLNGLNE